MTLDLKTVSLIGYLIVVVVLVCLFLEGSLLGSGPLSIVVQLLAVVLMVWARITFGRRSFHAGADPTKGGLVTTGPYSFIRHPIYASILYFMWAGVLSHPSAIDLLLGCFGTGGLFLRIHAEERLIVLNYPDYVNYAARTKRLIPFLI
jgi:protein-S-isoprenylcysteine O-methyltransferase Ste14